MIHLTFASPEKNIYEGEADKLIISTSTGEITVLSGHEPLLTTIDSGQVIIEKRNKDSKQLDRDIYSAFSGVVHVENNAGKTNVKVLLESSEDVKSLDSKVLEESIRRARLANVEEMGDFGLEINDQLLRDLNRLKLSRRYAK